MVANQDQTRLSSTTRHQKQSADALERIAKAVGDTIYVPESEEVGGGRFSGDRGGVDVPVGGEQE